MAHRSRSSMCQILAHLEPLCGLNNNSLFLTIASNSCPAFQCSLWISSGGIVTIHFEYSTPSTSRLNLFCSFNYFKYIFITNKLRYLNVYIIRYLIEYMNCDRMDAGKKIFENTNVQILRLDDHHYTVKSQTTNRKYDVISTESGFICNCPDHMFRKICCKHIHGVEFSIKFRAEVRERNKVVIEQIDCSNCPKCKSDNIVKHGIRKNKSGNLQRYSCKDCNKWFVFNIGFENMKTNPKAITSAMQLYFTGESLRNVQQFLRLQGVSVSHQTVYNWIKKYTKLMETYLNKIIPQVGDTWRADEIYTKVKGNMKYLFALIDDETRFLIAKEVADRKEGHDASGLFRQAKEKTGKRPKVMITDGLHSYSEAHKKEFWTNKNPRSIHIRHIHLQGDMNNNKMERFNGEFRDREKVTRGLKKIDSSLISGFQIFHNYIRPHSALKGKTPSEMCGIEIKGENKWLTLIQNSVKENGT